MRVLFNRQSRRGIAAAAVVAIAIAATWPVAAQDAVSLPLDNFLARLGAALRSEQASARTPQPLRAVVTAESRSGVRRLRIRDFQVLSDSERTIAGYNLGAGSWDTEIGVLGSAVATEFLFQAARFGISLEAVDVVFTS